MVNRGHGVSKWCPQLEETFPNMLPGWSAEKMDDQYMTTFMASPVWQFIHRFGRSTLAPSCTSGNGFIQRYHESVFAGWYAWHAIPRVLDVRLWDTFRSVIVGPSGYGYSGYP